MLKKGSQAGFINLRAVLWLLFLAVCIYAGLKFGLPEFSNYMLRMGVEEEAKNAHIYSDERIAGRVMEKAEAWSLPLEREGISIERDDANIKITVRYRVVVNFGLFGGYKHGMDYRIEVEKPIRRINP